MLSKLSAMDQFTTRATLLLRLRQSDPAPRELAWRDFHKRYAPVIARFARKMGAKPDRIDELVQDVIGGFFEAQARFSYDPAKGRFRGYLKTVTWRTLSRLRSKNKAVGLDQVDPKDVAVEQCWDDAWRKEHLKRAVDTVRRQYDNNATFRAFELLVFKGKDPQAVAQELQLNVQSVYKAKQRVTRALRDELRQLEDDEG